MKLETRNNKTLKLNNVLSRTIPTNELFNQSKYLNMMNNYIMSKNLQTLGPLILYSSGLKGLDADNNPIIETRIMIQLKQSSVSLQNGYLFDKEIKVNNCNMVRFNDKQENLQYATQKLTLYAYENDITLTGESYTIFIKQEDDKLLADVFMPVDETN